MSYAVPAESTPPVPAPEQASVTLFKTSLVLTPELEDELSDRCATRIDEVSAEMGLNSDGSVQDESWMGYRKRNLAVYDNDNDWRVLKYGGVFGKSNLSFGMAKRMVREMAAKTRDDLLGTRPFFAAVKTEMGDSSTARAIEELIQKKVDRTSIQDELMSAQRTAFIANEATCKIRYVIRSTPYVGPATVLVDETGQPIKSPNGLLIYQDDDFVDSPDVEGMVVLKKDPLFSMIQGQYQMQEFPALPQTLLQFEGVEVREMDYRSFLCPLRVPSVHEADFCAHLFDDTQEHLTATYGQYESFSKWSSGDVETSGERQPKTADGERQDEQRSKYLNMRSMAECYLRMPLGGVEVEVFAVFDRASKKVIFYDYLANVMPKRPFEVIPGVEKVANRWYGEGIIQMMLDAETYIDGQFNRFNLKDGRDSSIDFYHKGAVREWKNGETPVFGSEKPYAVEEGFDKENRPPVWRVDLREKSELGMALMEQAMQQANLQFGIIGAKDASATNMNSSRTATGILNIERTNNLLVKSTEIEQQSAIIRIMEQVVTLILENIKDTELLLSKDGKMLLTISKSEARSIDREIRLLLTRSRSSELLSTNQQALVLFNTFWDMKKLEMPRARVGRPLILNQLQGLEIADADELCPPVTDDDIKAWAEQQAASQKIELKRQSRESVAYKDMPPSVQAQWEAEMGFTPADPEERAAWLLSLNPPPPPPSQNKPPTEA